MFVFQNATWVCNRFAYTTYIRNSIFSMTGQEVRSQPASCSSGSRNSDEVQKQLEESMEDEGNGSGDVSKVTDQLEKSLNLTNENVDEEDDGDGMANGL